MSIRRTIVEIDPDTLNVTEFCRLHAISTWFFWDLRRRHTRDGNAALEPKSRAPHQVANKTPLGIEDAIVTKRKELADAGLDAGPATISWHLRHLDGLPSEASIWRILKRRGFITDDPSKAPRSSIRRFTAERANECWQLDDTTWHLANNDEVKILNIVDDHSRLLVASAAMPTCTGAATLTAVADAATTLGLPERFQSDNARAFKGVLADALAPLGVASRHSRPYHPQTNGKVERFHLTLQKWLDHQPPADTLADLQALLDAFRHLYNHQRPHRSLDRNTPATIWTNAPKSGPADQPIDTPTTTSHSTVHQGKINVGTRYRITIGSQYNGATTTTIITGRNCHVFINGHLVRKLTLDPTRNHQPLHNTPGHPTHQP